jgi:hypothetical protein
MIRTLSFSAAATGELAANSTETLSRQMAANKEDLDRDMKRSTLLFELMRKGQR